MTPDTIGTSIGKIERREWFLWTAAVMVTLLLTFGLASFLLREDDILSGFLPEVRGLIGLVLIFDIYTLYQQLQIHRMRRRLIRGEQLFRLISENAADMIAVVDMEGRRVFNSFSYEKVLGYSLEELQKSSAFEQIHPEDREKVAKAAEEARRTGVGKPLEYRVRHKDGTWRVLESTASVIRNSHGDPENLVIVNRDITERKRSAEALRRSEAGFRSVVEDAPYGIYRARLSGELVLVNSALEKCSATLHKKNFCKRIWQMVFTAIPSNIRSSTKFFCTTKISKTSKWSGSARMALPSPSGAAVAPLRTKPVKSRMSRFSPKT